MSISYFIVVYDFWMIICFHGVKEVVPSITSNCSRMKKYNLACHIIINKPLFKDDEKCHLCGEENGTLDHLLWFCPKSRSVREAALTEHGFPPDLPDHLPRGVRAGLPPPLAVFRFMMAYLDLPEAMRLRKSNEEKLKFLRRAAGFVKG